ncbi:glycoside hydrolase family 43 protein [Paraglaciecola sp.]|uniref:glycoside hydrolase family 43 protein n=1 Tax=Paraglaciecola sp. TaxID=1920173 RepID=UPI00273DF8A0|nr:glycoside hydrolase family 43 protein [Paraglaciecola sp.]MDP5029101.1 glycoside hydrolase family 43 protein [Paraglaciecola sp.]
MNNIVLLRTLLLSTLLGLSGCQQASEQSKHSRSVSNTVSFDWFRYQGSDALFSQALPQNSFQNPILSGFYPDPSITRKGNDYYMVNSSFAYAPGVPISHSRDLVNWRLIGHVLSQPSQLNMQNLQVSQGIYAPTLRYHEGVFYMITTLVAGGGNFIVTASDPAGPWSDPIWLPEIGGIDPDIFFDDDGKAYIAHNDAPQGEPLYQGHRAIWLWEFDLATLKVVPDSGRVIVNGGADISQQPIWVEGPHIYKINGWYYLSCAEGGTGPQHSQVVFRSKDLQQPFEPYAGNPILTQRDLPVERANPITSTGHADFIQTPEGEWWAVFLGTRPYQGNKYNTGRETFLLPVSWENEWPHILPQGEPVPYIVAKPLISKHLEPLTEVDTQTGNFVWQDDFDKRRLNPHWNLLRSLDSEWLSINDGRLNLQASQHQLDQQNKVSFVGRRQQHMTFDASTSVVLPQNEQLSGGMVAFQNEKFYYYFALQKQGTHYHLFVQQVNNGQSTMVAETSLPLNIGSALTLQVRGEKGLISFYYQTENKTAELLLKEADATMLSTEVAGGFVGTMLGLYVQNAIK